MKNTVDAALDSISNAGEKTGYFFRRAITKPAILLVSTAIIVVFGTITFIYALADGARKKRG